MVAVTAFVRGSILDTVPSPVFVTQINPSPASTPRGFLPTRMVARTRFDSGSMRVIELSSRFTTHTEPSPAAAPTGRDSSSLAYGQLTGVTGVQCGERVEFWRSLEPDSRARTTS